MKYIATLLAITLTGLILGQEKESKNTPIEVIFVEEEISKEAEFELVREGLPVNFPDVEAQFIGGAGALQKYISDNVYYPTEAIELNEQGRVYLSFIVEIDGSISNVEIIKGVSENLNQEAKRLIENMPNWTPGELDDEKVRTRCQIPINFTLTNGKDLNDRKKRRFRR